MNHTGVPTLAQDQEKIIGWMKIVFANAFSAHCPESECQHISGLSMLKKAIVRGTPKS